jgi:hypothetical protein
MRVEDAQVIAKSQKDNPNGEFAWAMILDPIPKMEAKAVEVEQTGRAQEVVEVQPVAKTDICEVKPVEQDEIDAAGPILTTVEDDEGEKDKIDYQGLLGSVGFRDLKDAQVLFILTEHQIRKLIEAEKTGQNRKTVVERLEKELTERVAASG